MKFRIVKRYSFYYVEQRKYGFWQQIHVVPKINIKEAELFIDNYIKSKTTVVIKYITK